MQTRYCSACIACVYLTTGEVDREGGRQSDRAETTGKKRRADGAGRDKLERDRVSDSDSDSDSDRQRQRQMGLERKVWE